MYAADHKVTVVRRPDDPKARLDKLQALEETSLNVAQLQQKIALCNFLKSVSTGAANHTRVPARVCGTRGGAATCCRGGVLTASAARPVPVRRGQAGEAARDCRRQARQAEGRVRAAVAPARFVRARQRAGPACGASWRVRARADIHVTNTETLKTKVIKA